MNRRKLEPADRRRRGGFTVTGLALVVALSSSVACSGGSSTSPTSSAPPTTQAATTTASATSVAATTPTPTTPAKPVAQCPKLKAENTPQVPLECTSATIIGAAAARAGLKRDGDDPTIVPIVYLLAYYRTVLIPVGYRREVNIFHYTNGAVASLLCAGVVAKTLDPTLGVCLDVGPSTRTDRATVRAWALRAGATIAKSAKAQPTLTSGKLTFVACSDPSFPKTSDHTVAFEMNIYIQHSGGPHASQDCAR